MKAQYANVASGAPNGLAHFTRHAVFLLFALVVTLFPAKEAKAETAVDVLLKVCAQVGDMCGPINDLKLVANSCFKKNVDEMTCALAIMSLGSGGQSQEAIKQVNAVASCVKLGVDSASSGKLMPSLADKAKFDATCRPILQEAGVNVSKIDEVYNIANKCLNADDVDDFIYCADALMDSSFVAEAELDIPSWVYTAFDLYISIDQKDYWGLVYNVGATVACAVANYYTGNDVCAFLADIAEFAGDAVEGVKKVGGALNNLGEKAFTNQTKHVPVVQFFNEYWLPEVDNYARAIVVQKNSGYWNANIGEKFKHCRNYFDGHTMSEDKASRACSDMRDGTAASDNSFIDNGFTQLASRRGAAMLLPELVKAAADARIAQLRSSGAFKATAVSAAHAVHDPWKGATEVPGVEGTVYRLYGLGNGGALEDPPLKRDAKTVNEAWRNKTVGYGAFMIAQAAKVEPKVLNAPASEGIAKKAIASSEKGIDVAVEVKAFIQNAQVERMKQIETLANMNKNLKESRDKPLNDTLAMCAPKATAVCEDEVRERFKVCDEKAQAFYDANAAAIGDFDSKRGKDAIKQWGDIRAKCEAEVRAYVTALPNVAGDSIGTQSCTRFLDRPSELVCSDAAAFLACRKQVDIGKLKTCRQPGVQQVYTKPSGTTTSGPGTINPGLPAKVPSTMGAGASPLTGLKPGGSAAAPPASNVTPPAPKLVPPVPQAVPPVPKVVPPVPKVVPPMPKVVPPAPSLTSSVPKVDEAALKTCKLFQARKDELQCSDARSFTACKAAVDLGRFKSCRITGSTDVYTKR